MRYHGATVQTVSLITQDSSENAEYHSIGNIRRFKPLFVQDDKAIEASRSVRPKTSP